MEVKTLYLGNLPPSTVQSDIEDLLAGLNYQNLRLVRDKATSKFKGFGYVDIIDDESLAAALERNGTEIINQKIVIDIARQRDSYESHGRPERNRGFKSRNYDNQAGADDPSVEPSIPTEPPFTAHFSNLSYDVTEESLAELLEGLHVQSVRIIRDKETDRSKGYGYVDFQNEESLREVFKLQGHVYNERAIRVKVANSKPTFSSSSASRTPREPGEHRGPRVHRETRDQREPRDQREQRRTVVQDIPTPTAEDEAARRKLVLKPRTQPTELIGQKAAPDVSKKQREDPFGGAKPRDEFRFQERVGQVPKKTEVAEPKQVEAPTSAAAKDQESWRMAKGNQQRRPKVDRPKK